MPETAPPPPPVVTVRACTPADAAALALVGAATLLESFAGYLPVDSILSHCAKYHFPQAYEAFLQQPQTRIWLAEAIPGAAPVGYAILTTPDFPGDLAREGDLELRRIYVFSRFHGGGAGKTLIQQAIEEARAQNAKRLLLGVNPDNARALAFYRRTGFQQIGTRTFRVGPSTFEDPVLALTL